MSATPITGTFATLESSFPGGFTGSRLAGVTVRSSDRTLEFALEFPAADGEPTRVALVRVTGVAWIDFEARDPKAGGKKVTMTVESDTLDAAKLAALGLPSLPAGAFAHRLHAQGTDGALCFAAESASLEWRIEPVAT